MTSEIISVPPIGGALHPGASPEAPPAPDALLDDPDTAPEQRAFAVPVAEHGLRIDKVLALHAPEFSRGYFQQLLEAGGVWLNGAVCAKPSAKVKAGDAVRAELRPTAQASAFVAEPMALQVVHEDEHLLVIDKPAGLVVHPAAGHWQGTLLNGLLAHHAGAAHLPRAGIVHRLDKDTSGLMLVAKSQVAVDALVRQIAAREVHRVYLALAHGHWRGEGERWVDQPIGRDPRNRLRMAVHPAGSTAAKDAQTRVRLLDAAPPWLLVGCKLHTGRTHQIRVHMAWLGHPLLADGLYGGAPALGLTRQALHAHRLALRHPVSGQPLLFHRPLPPDMAQAVETAGLHYNPTLLWPVDLP
ncbi:RluA family pseudouridine synthase [Aquabacterium sp. A08]|uniref:RluA family pseudouridine synthase n=1 Tax=Aquabacterium sp. A08 TaxID=2718532 RepID=UPI00141E9BD6|nr:RluA family pseudouridine synthase [Aquabacterium sp. A08]